MAFSATFSSQSPFPRPSPFSQPKNRKWVNYLLHHQHLPIVGVVKAAPEPERDKVTTQTTTAEETSQPALKLPKKPVYSMKKEQIVRVDKEKYLNSVNYLSVGHPPYYKGLDYIYEDRGEVLDLRIFETGEYALVAWVGIPTAPAWLPTDMLIKADKLDYERL